MKKKTKCIKVCMDPVVNKITNNIERNSYYNMTSNNNNLTFYKTNTLQVRNYTELYAETGALI